MIKKLEILDKLYFRFVPGMITSIEPGFYKENEYGIRLEDDAVTIDVGDGYISFEMVSFAMS